MPSKRCSLRTRGGRNILDRIKIGTRGSALALWQANFIAGRLKEKFPTLEVELIRVTTKGDKILDTPLSKIGGKGLFIKELEAQLLDGSIDLAVHSLKDVPTELPGGLTLAAITERAEPFDAFISNKFNSIAELPRGAIVGTSSLRRRAQLLAVRSDLSIEDLRGNVDTRLRRLDEGKFDAIILAAVGLKRLGHGDRIKKILPTSEMIPAVGQGALAIEIAEGGRVENFVRELDDPISRAAVSAERSFLKIVEGGCQIPVGVFASIVDGNLYVEGVIASIDGRELVRGSIVGSLDRAAELGAQLAHQLLDDGGRNILDTINHG